MGTSRYIRIVVAILWACLCLDSHAQVKPAISPAGLTVTNLRVENLAGVLGLDEKSPRLSWLVESAERGQKPTAYRIVVSRTVDALKQDKGDQWDTGKVASDQISQIIYGGKPLQSHHQYFWKVQAWDKDDKPSPWSAESTWSMGFLNPAEWKGQWIGYDKAREVKLPDAPLDGAKWIWMGNERGTDAPRGIRVFMANFALPDRAKIEKAELLVAGDKRYWFTLNGKQVAGSAEGASGAETAATIDVTADVNAGKNFFRAQVENYVLGPAGLIAKLTVTTTDGKVFTFVTDESWHATKDGGANWHNREIAEDAWPKCSVTGDYGIKPWGKVKYATLQLPPPALLRKEFPNDKAVRRATLYATALGLYDITLNGKRVNEDLFGPGWTDYTKRVYYRAYDVTKLLKPGDNAWCAVLADGWYCGYVGFNHLRDHYGKKSRLRAQIHIEYDDDTTADLSTGPDWKATSGPYKEADFLMGESYDPNLMPEGWEQNDFDMAKWDKVDVGAEVSPVIQHHPGPPVKLFYEFKPVAITEPQPGVFVLDMGQNFAGFARLKITGEKDQKISLRFAERLKPDGMLYTTNLRGARVTDTYICKGSGVETWEPRFTYHGFQYIEVTGLKAKPAEDTITGVAITSETPSAGSFICSDPILNQLYRNITWTQRANFIDIPTDCPQRDERLGWTGDAQVYIRTAAMNADVEAFFTKWLTDLTDGQRKDGEFPMVAPVKVAGDDGGPAWADAGVICPWTIYEVYGDKRILERHYDSMVKFVEFCRARSTPELLPPKQYHCFGDWLSIGADTPKDVIYMAYFAKSVRLVAQAASVLGKTDDAKKYNDIFAKIKAAFNFRYVDSDGHVEGNTQAGYVLAIAFDLLDDSMLKLAAKHLAADIEKRKWHLSTGFIGTKDLMLALSKIDRNDLAFKLLHQDTFPSWEFSIKQGATSIWERWDGWTPSAGFQDPGMNSFSHYSFGAVYQWMVENLGGIQMGTPGYQEIVIRPQIDPNLRYARTAYRSVRGRIESSWKRDNEKFSLDVTIPPGCTASVYLPAAKTSNITESGKPVTDAPGVTFQRPVGDRAYITIGSGTYHFASTVALPAGGMTR
jgi:alpha-L-rhamnosidase